MWFFCIKKSVSSESKKLFISKVLYSSSGSDSDGSASEVTSLLCGSGSSKASLVLAETSSVGLATLVSQVSWSVFLVSMGLSGWWSSLLVQDGEDLSNCLSDNL